MSLTDGGGIFVLPELALILKRDEQPLELKAKAEVVRPELSVSSLTHSPEDRRSCDWAGKPLTTDLDLRAEEPVPSRRKVRPPEFVFLLGDRGGVGALGC